MIIKIKSIPNKIITFATDYYYSNRFFQNRKVDFLVIGVQKAGTTSLFNFLSQHPQCVGSKYKEVHFFNLDYRYSNGERWYHQQFSIKGLEQNRGESVRFFEISPGYIFNSKSPKRISKYNPDIKLILILREPASRAYSSWNMWRQFRKKNPKHIIKKYANKYVEPCRRKAIIQLLTSETYPEFEHFVKREINFIENGTDYPFPYFIKRGLYAEQITRYLEYFNREQILILESTFLKQRKIETLQQIEIFLEIDFFDWDNAQLENLHVRTYVEKSDASVLEQLKSFYRPYNEQLFDLIDCRFDW